jgi:HlyD family secretion protein
MNPTNQSPVASARRNNNARRRRRLLPQLGAVVLVALIVAGFWPEPAPVETVRVMMGQLRATVNEEGKTRIRHRYLIAAPVTGQLQRIALKAGPG